MIKELTSLVNIKSYSRRGNVQIIFKEGVKNEECGSRTSEQYGFRAQRIDAI